MSITRDQLKVGETYQTNVEDKKRTVLYIGNKAVFYEWVNDTEAGESQWDIKDFLKHNSIIKPEPKKLGEVAWFKHLNGIVTGAVVGSDDFQDMSERTGYQRVTIKNNEIWSYDD